MCETSKQGEYSLKCNYPKESEATVNSLINLLFTGTYECHAMAYYFMNDQVAQRGLAKLHKHLANAQYELVEKLMVSVIVPLIHLFFTSLPLFVTPTFQTNIYIFIVRICSAIKCSGEVA